MIAFSTIHSLLDILPQGQRIDIVKEVERTENTWQGDESETGIPLSWDKYWLSGRYDANMFDLDEVNEQLEETRLWQ